MIGLRRVAVVCTAFVFFALCSRNLQAKECHYFGTWFWASMPMEFSVEQIWSLDHDPTQPRYFKEAGIDMPRLEEAIAARGEIKADSGSKFEQFLRQHPSLSRGTLVVLDSPGGVLDDGLAIGDAIRDRGFDTVIGDLALRTSTLLEPDPIRAAACLSACTFTFLGGVNRRVHDHDLYGVHRFHGGGPDIDVAQQTVGKLLGYVRNKGVDQALIEDMTAVGPEEINSLNVSRLVELRVVTSHTPLKDEGTPQGFECK